MLTRIMHEASGISLTVRVLQIVVKEKFSGWYGVEKDGRVKISLLP
jgi:hypothetical protein